MNASTVRPSPDTPRERTPPPLLATDPRLTGLAREVGRGLQLSRSTALSLTRLQLAIHSGDRRQALAALDRLHTLDAELEHLVAGLPGAARDDAPDAEPETALDAALIRHLEEQKLALAFEKLALVSEISGPDLVSDLPPGLAPPQPAASAAPAAPTDDEPPLSDWPRLPAVRAVEWSGPPTWLLGLVATVLVMGVLAAAVVALM